MRLLDGFRRHVRPWLAALALLVTTAALTPAPVLAQDYAAPVATTARPDGSIRTTAPSYGPIAVPST